MQKDFDEDLLAYFTNVDYLRDLFKESVAAPTLSKRLLAIHGVGGVGKSSLLQIFRLHCKNANIPVAIASGDEAKSTPDVLYLKSPSGDEHGWVPDLKTDGVRFPRFDVTYKHYREIQAKVYAKTKQAGGSAADIASKAASKTAEAVGGALAGAAVGSVIPGVGTAVGGALGGLLGGMGSEALTDWLRGFLKQPDIDLLLDPDKRLTDDFLYDLTKAANKQRIVLILDTFEQMTTLNDWARDVAYRLQGSNVFLVVAGRALPDWNRKWQTWMAKAEVAELEPMTEDVMRDLVRRYYATMRGGEPNPTQVEAIIRFARGLPIVVTSAVQLWVKYGVEDFQSIKPEVVTNLVDRLTEGVPTEVIPALEAAAVVRWFNPPILRAVMKKDDVRDLYDELRRFPFVRVRVEGLALHDAVREILDENLRVQDIEQHSELHKRAAIYFETKLEQVSVDEIERLQIERLYQRVLANEVTGVELFLQIAEGLARSQLTSRLQVLMNDMNRFPLRMEKSLLWREYYNAKLADLGGYQSVAVEVYKRIAKNTSADLQLRAYAACDCGTILSGYQYVGQEQNADEAKRLFEFSLQTGNLDIHLLFSLQNMAQIARAQGDWEQERTLLSRSRQFLEEQRDKSGLAYHYLEEKRAPARRGLWKEFQSSYDAGESTLAQISPELLAPKALLLGEWCCTWAWMGRYAKAERNAREALTIANQLQDEVLGRPFRRDLGWMLGYQDIFDEAEQYFVDSLDVINPEGEHKSMQRGLILTRWGHVLVRCGDFSRAEEYLIQGVRIHEDLKFIAGIQEPLNYLGIMYETQREYNKARDVYERSLSFKGYGGFLYNCAALTGFIRVKYALGEFVSITQLIVEAERLAQQYEYNDHLAALRLSQGMIADHTGTGGQSEPLDYFKPALIFALRFNRFLLDEILNGRPQGTALHPIISYCRGRGKAGLETLVALRDWWKVGINDIGASRPDTISPIPEGISLLEAEKIAREREPGDGSPQKTVLEQIDAALLTQVMN